MAKECEHGQLARNCNICELEKEVADLQAQLSEVRAQCERLRVKLQEIGSYAPQCFDESIPALLRETPAQILHEIQAQAIEQAIIESKSHWRRVGGYETPMITVKSLSARAMRLRQQTKEEE